MDIGLQIKKFREQQKISQEELALKIFVSRQTISNWETNKSCPDVKSCLLYTSPSPRDRTRSRMPSSA